LGSKKKAVAEYYQKIEFYDLPDGIVLSGVGSPHELALYRGTETVSVGILKPKKVLEFNHGFEIWPMIHSDANREAPFLLCLTPNPTD
jgi:hypothetical protein